ncbi:hypothetical protein OG225_00350 [Nocardia sp. NBC_01377]|uniref:hypothetical protein n=1 Tax=Nocardia sp. NBC_01377 TaxID=2903595 RepID=UPI003250B0AA
MIILIGLLVLIAAVVVGVAGVAANTGEVRTDTSDFGVFDYHFTASAGELFLWGMAVGAIGMLGLSLLLLGVWRSSRRGAEARRELRKTRREKVAVERNAPTVPPAAPKKQISEPTPAQKPVWSLNRFLPKSSEPASVSTSSRPAADVSASK